MGDETLSRIPRLERDTGGGGCDLISRGRTVHDDGGYKRSVGIHAKSHKESLVEEAVVTSVESWITM